MPGSRRVTLKMALNSDWPWRSRIMVACRYRPARATARPGARKPAILAA
jgi:hypothetical protein